MPARVGHVSFQCAVRLASRALMPAVLAGLPRATPRRCGSPRPRAARHDRRPRAPRRVTARRRASGRASSIATMARHALRDLLDVTAARSHCRVRRPRSAPHRPEAAHGRASAPATTLTATVGTPSAHASYRLTPPASTAAVARASSRRNPGGATRRARSPDRRGVSDEPGGKTHVGAEARRRGWLRASRSARRHADAAAEADDDARGMP